MPLILGTNSIKDTGYNVANSLRFNQGSSDYLNRTNGSSTGKIWSFSCWFKISDPSDTNMNIFNVSSDANNTTYVEVATKSQNGLDIQVRNGSGTTYIRRRSSAVLRDVTSWYNAIVIFDSTNSTADDRIKVFLNGSRLTSFQENVGTVDADYVTQIGVSNAAVEIGRNTSAAHHFDGYLAEIVLVDGTALSTTDFGEFDEDSPTIWKPKDVSGLTFGTNGFHLDFENASSLGADVSGNSNNFTVNNLTSVDQSTDTCTLNYSTMNPIQNVYGKQTFSNGNLQIVSPSGDASAPHSTFGVSSGRWYVEAKLDSAGSNQTLIGVSSNEATQTDYHLGRGATSYGMLSSNGKIYNNNDGGTAYGSGYSAGNILGIYLDLEDNKLYFSVNGTLQNSGTGHSITAATSTELGFYFFSGMQWDNAQSCQWSFNFGSPNFSISSSNTDDNSYGNFEYSPNITGDGSAKKFYALNSKNLAEFG